MPAVLPYPLDGLWMCAAPPARKMFALLGGFAVVPLFGALIFAIPFTWLWYMLWSGKGEPVRQPQQVR